jgi:hypothetical protein
MRNGLRYSNFLLVPALLLCFAAVCSAQQPEFYPDFSGPTDPYQFVQLNGYPFGNGNPSIAQWNGATVLRLSDGSGNPEASTVYFQQQRFSLGVGEQPVIQGFTTWFQFQAHNLQCCAPGDGFAFIVQFSPGTDPSYGATGAFSGAIGAGNGSTGGGMGYAGINNSLAIEFDLAQNAWDPNGNHIAIQTCGPGTNTPVHENGNFTIGNHQNVPNCIYPANTQPYTPSVAMGGACNGESCTDGSVHDVVISYNPPSAMQPGGLLQIWLDPQYLTGTHTPKGRPNVSVPYNLVYDQTNNPLGLRLDTRPGKVGYAWVGFTSSQPSDAMQMDIRAWEYTASGLVQIQQVIQPGGTPTDFNFGSHQTTVTYPAGFQNPGNIVMNVTATPVDRIQFYQTRLLGTQFANEQCIVYQGTSGGNNPIASGDCIVYTYSCQDQSGNQVNCPTESDPTIVINTTFYTTDNVTPTNADYLENDFMGSNNWMSIFTGYQTAPIDGTTSGGSRGFGGSGSSKPLRSGRKFLTPSADTADIVATFNPSKP